MSWKKRYKRKKKNILIEKFKSFQNELFEGSSKKIILILFFIIFYSAINYNFLKKNEITSTEKWNKKKIIELNLDSLYSLKNMEHNNVDLWILNNTNQKGLAAKIRDCHEKGYYIKSKKTRGDYNILKQDNFNENIRFDIGNIDQRTTKIFVHVDTLLNPNFKYDIYEYLSFTGYNNDIVNYIINNKLENERDITLILGEDWNDNSNLIHCSSPIN